MEDALEWDFRIELAVRDYELDAQAIVNNSVYMNYLEHCRHEYLRSLNLDFHALHEQGVDPVVVRSEIDFLRSLRSGDRFRVLLRVSPRGRAKYVFGQEIRRIPDDLLITRAQFTVATLVNGRPGYAAVLMDAMEQQKNP